MAKIRHLINRYVVLGATLLRLLENFFVGNQVTDNTFTAVV